MTAEPSTAAPAPEAPSPTPAPAVDPSPLLALLPHVERAARYGFCWFTSSISGRGLVVHVSVVGTVQDTGKGGVVVKARTRAGRGWQIGETLGQVMQIVEAATVGASRWAPSKE